MASNTSYRRICLLDELLWRSSPMPNAIPPVPLSTTQACNIVYAACPICVAVALPERAPSLRTGWTKHHPSSISNTTLISTHTHTHDSLDHILSNKAICSIQKRYVYRYILLPSVLNGSGTSCGIPLSRSENVYTVSSCRRC